MLIQLLVGIYGLIVVVVVVLLTLVGGFPQSIDAMDLLLNLLAPAVFIYLINGLVAKFRLAISSRT